MTSEFREKFCERVFSAAASFTSNRLPTEPKPEKDADVFKRRLVTPQISLTHLEQCSATNVNFKGNMLPL
jgi:hypothetical protein